MIATPQTTLHDGFLDWPANNNDDCGLQLQTNKTRLRNSLKFRFDLKCDVDYSICWYSIGIMCIMEFEIHWLPSSTKLCSEDLSKMKCWKFTTGLALFGLSKPGGDVRPIGYTLIRLRGKLAKSNMGDIYQKVVRPRQIGVGLTKRCWGCSPCNEMNHLWWRLWRMVNRQGGHGKHPQFCCGDKIIQKVLQVALYPITWQAYAKPTTLFYGDDFLLSEEGVRSDRRFPASYLLFFSHTGNGRLMQVWWEFSPESVKLSKMITWGWLILLLPWVYGWNHKMLTSSIYPDNCNAVQSLKALLPLFMSKSYKTVII